jgi:hypothetical protein
MSYFLVYSLMSQSDTTIIYSVDYRLVNWYEKNGGKLL